MEKVKKLLDELIADSGNQNAFRFEFHEAYAEDENLSELTFYAKPHNSEEETLVFTLADNRLYMRTDIDIFDSFVGILESIDGVEQTITLYYDNEEDTLKDIEMIFGEVKLIT